MLNIVVLLNNEVPELNGVYGNKMHVITQKGKMIPIEMVNVLGGKELTFHYIENESDLALAFMLGQITSGVTEKVVIYGASEELTALVSQGQQAGTSKKSEKKTEKKTEKQERKHRVKEESEKTEAPVSEKTETPAVENNADTEPTVNTEVNKLEGNMQEPETGKIEYVKNPSPVTEVSDDNTDSEDEVKAAVPATKKLERFITANGISSKYSGQIQAAINEARGASYAVAMLVRTKLAAAGAASDECFRIGNIIERNFEILK